MSKTDTMAASPLASAPASMTRSASSPAHSAEYLAHLSRERRRRHLILGSQATLTLLFFLAWEILPRANVINPLFTSYPSALWPTFLTLIKDANLAGHVTSTVLATVIGFSLSMLLGTVIAAALWWSPFAYKVLDPFLVVANAMPKIAFVPIFYIWLGATNSVYGMAVAIAVFITIMMVYSGFSGIDPNKIKLTQTFGATRWQTLTKVVLPGSMPTLIATLKVNVGLSLVGVIVGEFQSASLGLGYLIVYGGQIFKLNIVMTAIVILALISGVMYLGIHMLERTLIKHYT
jgi:NitT/TauT family transport system permease protein